MDRLARGQYSGRMYAIGEATIDNPIDQRDHLVGIMSSIISFRNINTSYFSLCGIIIFYLTDIRLQQLISDIAAA
jgi:hypothetical protein